MHKDNQIVCSRNIDTNENEELVLELNISFKYGYIQEMGASRLFDLVFDNLNLLLKEATIIENKEKKTLSP